MNFEALEELAAELGFTVDTAEELLFEAHKDGVTVRIDGTGLWGLTTTPSGMKMFRFFTSGNIDASALIQLENAVSFLP